jgi:hypothetical protein
MAKYGKIWGRWRRLEKINAINIHTPYKLNIYEPYFAGF